MTCDSHCGGCGPMELALPSHDSGASYNVAPNMYETRSQGMMPSHDSYASNVNNYVSSGSSSYIR